MCERGSALVYAAMIRLMLRRLTRLCGLFIQSQSEIHQLNFCES
jgi:hypothetical protein